MQGPSAASFATLAEALRGQVDNGADPEGTAADLSAAAGVLAREVGLRRVLTDPSHPAEARSGLVDHLFRGKLGDAALGLVSSAASRRWASSTDLVDALQRLSVVAVVTGAEKAGEAETLQDDLFGIARLVQGNQELSDALQESARPVQDRQALLRGLLEGKVSGPALRLADQAVAADSTLGRTLADYQEIAATSRGGLVATVRVARPLDEGGARRLREALTKKYGKPVHTNVLVSPDVVGGIKVEIGDEIIDGTISSRLDDARRRLAG